MRASESPFECYKSERILSFAYLMCISVSRPKPLKKRVCDLPYSISGKNTEHFRNRIKKIRSVRTKIALIENLFQKRKFSQTYFVVYVLIYSLSKFGGNWTNSLWVLAFYSVPFKWKNSFEKTVLNMQFRRVIFTSRQNLKWPFLCQYLRVFFNDFFFILEMSFESLPF